ncbi:MAG TPA: HAD-IC family P-type ATPase, partial [Actinophytocola sp.]|uniref:HAD-IC family P-type ATPase n=1 Tax=Actinophytocola sp. TaxID=1872138 RepID=UPI002DDCB986
PKAPGAAQAAFAARLGRLLARRGALVMDRAALRGIELIDTLVLDAGALGTGRWLLRDLVPFPDSDPTELAEHAFQLFNETDLDSVHRSGHWALGPLDELDLTGRKGARERDRLSKRGAARVLGLARDRHLQAVLAVEEETAPGADTVAAAARDEGLRVLVADGRHRTRFAFADDVIEDDLVAGVRRLQADGHVVALLSGNRRALGAADLGIGTHRPGEPPPWGAHLLVGEDLDTAALTVGAVGMARRVTADGMKLAIAASGIGAVNALNVRGRGAARSLRAVNTGAALAFVDGVWRARTLGRRDPAPSGGAGQPWHLMPAETVLQRLGTDRTGLSDKEADRRLTARPGAPGQRTGFTRAFLAELANPLTPVLAGGAAVSAAVGSATDAALVTSVIGLSALIGSIQQVHTERALASLLERSAVSATVIRDGRKRTVNANELVVGDIVAVESGDVVPADCRLLEAVGLEADESSLTGESLPVAKDAAPVVAAEIADRTSMLFEGTTVAAGRAVAVVVATGEATEVGRGLAAARRAAPTTGVEARLTELTRKSLPIAVASATAVAGLGQPLHPA